MIKRFLICFLAAAALSSCVAVKGYEKVNLNDPDMALSPTAGDAHQSTFQGYREAASGANGGSTGGGCGCN